MNGLKKTETNTSIFFFFAGFFNFLCPSICLLVCIFFCLHPSHLCLGVSWVFSILSTTDPSSTLLSLMVRLVSRGSDLPARGRRSLSSLLTSGLLYRSVRWDWSLSSAAWRSCLSCSITLSLQHLSEIYTSAVLHRLWVTKYVGGLQSLLLYNAQAMPGCWLGYNIPPNKNMVIFIS